MKILKCAVAAAALASLIPAAAHAETAAPAASGAAAKAGQMLYDAGGRRVGNIYRVTAEGGAQVILDGKLVTAPASTLTINGSKVTTSLTKSDLSHAK